MRSALLPRLRRTGLGGLLLALFLLVATAPRASAEPGLPPHPESAPLYGQTVPLYDQSTYPYTAYTWDGEQWSSASYATVYTGMNLVLVGKAWFVKVAIRLTEWATEPTLTATLFDQVADPSAAIGQALWSTDGAPLVAGGIALIGGWTLLLYLQGRRSRAWGALGTTALLLVLAAAVLPSSARVARAIGGISDGLATALVSPAEGAVAAGGAPPILVRAGDGAWRRLVYEPWLEGELSAEGAERYKSLEGLPGGTFLAMTNAQRRAECLLSGTENCPDWQIDALPQRLLAALATSGMALLWGGALLVLSGGLLLTRLTLAALMLLSPVWLLVALWWPEQTLGLLRRIGGLAIGVVIKQLLLTAGLLLFLLLSSGVHGLLSDGAWPLPALLLALLGAGTIRYRYTWFRPLAALPGATLRTRVQRAQQERPRRMVAEPLPPEGRPIPVAMPPAAIPPAFPVEAPSPEPLTVQSERPLRLLRQEALQEAVRRQEELLLQAAAARQMDEPLPAVHPSNPASGAAERGPAPQPPGSQPVSGPPTPGP